MATVGSLNVKIGVNLKEFESGMRKLDKQLLDVEKQFKGSFWTGKRFEAMGKKLTAAVTVPIVGMGAAAAKASIDLESAFAGVEKTVRGTDAELAALRQGFDDLSRQIPVATTEIYGIGEAAGQLGIEKQYILGFTEVMAKLGSTTNLSSTEAATSLARLANITQMPKDQFDRLGATVVALDGSLATTASEIVNMGLRLAGAGNVAGMTEADILSLSGALSSVGIEAQAGGSAMSKVILNMNNEVLSSGEHLQSFAEIAGMTADEFATAWQENASQALVAFIQGLGEMQAQGENIVPVLDELGFSELRVRDALLRAAGAGDLFTEALEVGSAAWEENMALNEAAEKRYQTLAAQLQMLKNELTLLAGSFGDILTPAIGNAIECVRNLAQTLAGLDEGKKKLIITIAGLAASIGPLLWALGALMKSTSNIKIGLDMVKGAVGMLGSALSFLAANPIVVVIGALTLLAAWAVKTAGGWENTKVILLNAWNVMAGGAGNAALTISREWNLLKRDIYNIVNDILDSVAPLANYLPGFIKGGFENLRAGVKEKLADVEQNLNSLEESMARNSDRINSSISTIKTTWGSTAKESGESSADIAKNFRELEQSSTNMADTISASSGQAGQALDDFGDKATGTGNKVRQVSEIIEATLGSALDTLRLKLQISQAEFELTKAKMGENVDEIKILEAELESLTEQYNVQTNIVAELQAAYDEMVAKKMQATEEGEKLYLQLLREQTALENLRTEREKANKAIEEQISSTKRLIEVTDDYITIGYAKGSVKYKRSSGGTVRGFSSKEKEEAYDKKMRDEGAPSWLFHDGGWVGKPRNLKFDELIGKLQHGEFVLSRSMVDSFGSLLEIFSKLFDGMKGISMPSIPKIPTSESAGIDYDRLGQAIAKHSKPNVTMYNEYSSPDPLTPSTINRKNDQLLRKLALEWGM